MSPLGGVRALPVALLLVLTAAAGSPAGQPAPSPGVERPRLLVLLVVDQLRIDYLSLYGHQWQHGLRRLLDEGAQFPLAAFPYFNTVTCAGHATVATGALPRTHGMVLNRWWDRREARRVACTEDPAAEAISYTPSAGGRHSPVHLEVTTLADELRLQSSPPARVVSLSLKPRAAVSMAGQRADAVLWYERGWAGSSAYGPGPVPFIEAFIRDHPLEREPGKVWERALPPAEYVFEEETLGRRPPAGWGPLLPHRVGGREDGLDAQFHAQWENTPFADEYLARLAAHSVEHLGLGRGPGTDYLAVSFSVLDLVGHKFGPASHQVQDVLIRLDRTIGRLLADLDRLVGRSGYVVALTADHGVAPIPEQARARGIDAGRFRSADIVQKVNAALEPFLGEGTHAAWLEYTDFYFGPGVYDRLRKEPAALAAAIDAIRSSDGIARVIRSEELGEGRFADDPLAAAAARSYFPGRSGDLIVLQRPYWMASSDATTHGTGYAYDTRVPVILAGAGIRPGEYLVPATPADIAPTLAHLAGIILPAPDGRVLIDALAPAPADGPQPSLQNP